MMEQNVILNVFLIFFLCLKVSAGVGRNLAVLKFQLQVNKLQSLQIYLGYMKQSVCASKNRRGEHFSYRNVYICHAVFEIAFLFRVT